MTREHKLALVIGFGLILFVGILLSDHLRHESPQNEPLPSASNTLWSMPKSLEPKRPAQLTVPTEYATAIEVPSPVIPDRTPLSEFRSSLDEPTASTPITQLSWKPNQTSIQPIHEEPKPTPVMNSRSSDLNRVTHTVKEGETLQEISHTYFGTTRRWKEISDLNGMSNGNMVRQGQKLVLPNNQIRVDVNVRKPQSATRGQSYTVRKGDNLSTISQKTLGTSRRWREIQDLNGIENPNSLKIGDVLNIPQK